ncbi:MAG: AAA family ATPase [Prevotellaceae bacterium]|jgi:predicted ATPase|nr:AAA family ATPase [Prevotellaceae bacterium]
MKLSIRNFKTIGELKRFNFNSINIISGVNSSGKTSFIQFLLVLKQTAEAQSANPALIFDGNRIRLGNFADLVYKKDINNSIEFELQFDKEYIRDKFPSVYGIENVIINAVYSLNGEKTNLNNIRIAYQTPQTTKKEHYINFECKNNKYKISYTYSALFGKSFMGRITNPGILNTVSFIPSTFIIEIDNPNYRTIEDLGLLDTNPTQKIAIEIKAQEIQSIVNEFFNNISYIGPLREEPQDLYRSNSTNKDIGSKGEYAAQFFEEEANNLVEFYDIQNNELNKMSLSDAVKYWICDVFNLAKDIKTDKYKDSYVVKIVNHYNVESTIRQVGFGISQVLPIIVEGLRMNKNGILILEQPEIHLHPKVQSALFDFIYSLSLTGKKFLIETHSDHFITRMRRRVAEDENKLSEKINLVFVEQKEAEHLFHKLNLDDMGTFDYFPVDFVEQTEDFGAIIMAQAKKAKTKQN